MCFALRTNDLLPSSLGRIQDYHIFSDNEVTKSFAGQMENIFSLFSPVLQ